MPVYEPPRGDLPEGVETGEVHGQFFLAVDDSTDPGIETDSIPAQGEIRFIPSTPYVEYGNQIVLLDQRSAILDPTGSFRIDLVATNNTGPIENWTYTVQFYIQGAQIPSFRIDVPAHSNRALADIAPRVVNDAFVTVKGDKGDKGDLSIVGVTTFVDPDGDLAFDDERALYFGSGTPNGNLYKSKGNLYVDYNATSDFLYVKTTAIGSNTGWVVIK